MIRKHTYTENFTARASMHFRVCPQNWDQKRILAGGENHNLAGIITIIYLTINVYVVDRQF